LHCQAHGLQGLEFGHINADPVFGIGFDSIQDFQQSRRHDKSLIERFHPLFLSLGVIMGTLLTILWCLMV
jgi:hypothetical protein